MKAKRITSFEERKKIRGEKVTSPHYVCGCGNFLWILTQSGDCVCGQCMRAQVRITVTELAPVKSLRR